MSTSPTTSASGRRHCAPLQCPELLNVVPGKGDAACGFVCIKFRLGSVENRLRTGWESSDVPIRSRCAGFEDDEVMEFKILLRTTHEW